MKEKGGMIFKDERTGKKGSITTDRMTICLALTLILGICAAGVLSAGSVPNGSLNQGRGAMKPERVAMLRQNGWQCPDAKDWPDWWNGQGAKMKIEWPRTGGRNNDGYGRISGGVSGYVNGYWGKFFKGNEILVFWARGKGTIRVGLMAYKFSDDHKKILPGGSVPGFDIKVNSNKWVRYRYLMKKPDYELNGHPLFQAPEGVIDFDDVDIIDSDPALDLIVEEENKLYGTGALIENLDMVQADEVFSTRAKQYQAAVKAFRAAAPRLDKKLVEALQSQIEALNPYIVTPGVTMVHVPYYNDMIVMTRVLNRLAGKAVGKPVPVKAKGVKPIPEHYPGRREARPGTVTITNIRSNKVRYNENEAATTIATIVNKGNAAVSGTLIARMILDLDTVREIARANFSIAPGQEKKWKFSYNVGPETYGRAIEVRFVDDKGNLLDKWQEYYAVAAEFFRVHQHCFNTATKYWPADVFIFYFNQSHYFGHEPTDLGVHPFDAEIYISGQPGYRVNVPVRKAQIAYNKKVGVATTFYQTGAFGGQMGYEEVRKHPEYALYDENGQFSVDPIYGGYPNPMELASPLEVGPKRKNLKIKPYLDREYTPWQHVAMNMAMEDAVVYATKCMKEYAKVWGFDGVYWDGCLGIWDGYNYDGAPNVPSRKYEDYVRLNARNHRIFNEILKKDNPLFGTWYNWGLAGTTAWTKERGLKLWLGTGVEGDPLDDSIRAATEWKNVMILDEVQSLKGFKCEEMLERLLRDRDHFVQKYGANKVIGYMSPGVPKDEPGPTKWAWPTWNYFLSQLIATQSHFASFFIPSYRPSLQFMTRYSRFIWARDIKAVPVEKAEKVIRLKSPEKIWWKRLVYRRELSDGYDLIVHLVRIPPTERFDFNWADEPEPLKGVRISADIGSGKLETAQACRPYYFEEEQQVVQKVLKASARSGRVVIEVPPFRYHTMVVFRVKKKH